MDRELVEKWVAALESGEYKRGSGALHFTHNGEHRFCPLGVLADVMSPDCWHPTQVALGLGVDDDAFGQIIWEEGYGYLTDIDCEFLPGDEPWHPDQDTQDHVAKLNDDAPNDDTSYQAVIPWIRANLM